MSAGRQNRNSPRRGSCPSPGGSNFVSGGVLHPYGVAAWINPCLYIFGIQPNSSGFGEIFAVVGICAPTTAFSATYNLAVTDVNVYTVNKNIAYHISTATLDTEISSSAGAMDSLAHGSSIIRRTRLRCDVAVVFLYICICCCLHNF